MISYLICLALLAACGSALAAEGSTTYLLEPAAATVTLSDKYTVLREGSMEARADLPAGREESLADMLADWADRGVLMQAWTSKRDACLEIRAIQDEEAQEYQDFGKLSKARQSEYKSAHLEGEKYQELGYDIESAVWVKKANGSFLELKYTREVNGETVYGYAEKTVRKGWSVILDFQVYGREQENNDLRTLQKARNTMKFGVTPKKNMTVVKLISAEQIASAAGADESAADGAETETETFGAENGDPDEGGTDTADGEEPEEDDAPDEDLSDSEAGENPDVAEDPDEDLTDAEAAYDEDEAVDPDGDLTDTENTDDAEEDEAAEGEAEEADGTESEDIPVKDAGTTRKASAETNTQGVVGYRDGDYQYMYLGTYPYEKNGKEAPLLWRVLGREGDTVTMFTEYIIDNVQVMFIDNYEDGVKKHKYPKVMEFENTDLYAWVNAEMTETILKTQDFSGAIVEYNGGKFYIMDNSELRKSAFGFPNTTYGNTIEQPGEQAVALAGNRKGFGTPYAKNKVLYPDWHNPNHPKWNKMFQFTAYGNSSPYWTSKMRGSNYYTGIVGGNGHLSWSGMADVQKGVRPAVKIDVTKLRIVSGSGTEKDPWIMEMNE